MSMKPSIPAATPSRPAVKTSGTSSKVAAAHVQTTKGGHAVSIATQSAGVSQSSATRSSTVLGRDLSNKQANALPSATPRKPATTLPTPAPPLKPTPSTTNTTAMKPPPPAKTNATAAVTGGTNTSSLTRMSLPEMRRFVEQLMQDHERVSKERDSLHVRIAELELELRDKERRVRDAEEQAALSAAQLSESAAQINKMNERLSRAEQRLEALGYDPLTLCEVTPSEEERLRDEAEVARFGATLGALHAKLHVSHEALQSNIGRMTDILTTLNGHAAAFAHASTALGDDDDEELDADAVLEEVSIDGDSDAELTSDAAEQY